MDHYLNCTILCKAFEQTGYCQRGVNCTYAHGHEELRCKVFATTGHCKNDRCLLRHTHHQPRRAATVHAAAPVGPGKGAHPRTKPTYGYELYRTSLCKWQENDGYCERRERQGNCWFAHSTDELRCKVFATGGACNGSCGRNHYHQIDAGVSKERIEWGTRPPTTTPSYERPLNPYPMPQTLQKLIPLDPIDVSDARQRLLDVANNLLRTPDIQKKLRMLECVEACTNHIDLCMYSLRGVGLQRVPSANRYVVYCDGLEESRPSVLRGDRVKVRDEVQKKWYGGWVHFADINKLTVSLPPAYPCGPYNSVVFMPSRTQEWLRHRAIDEFDSIYLSAKRCRTEKRLSRRSAPWRDAIHHPAKLTNEQQGFVDRVTAEKAPAVLLLWGPPGTGKTTTVVATVVETLLRTDKHHNILLVAPSNDAVDLLVQRLLNSTYDELVKRALGKPMCELIRRVNAPSRTAKHVAQEVRQCSDESHDGGFFIPPLVDIKRYRVVLATVSTSSTLFSIGVDTKHFTHLFIDEAGHTTEADLLLPLQTAPHALRTVLAGDHKQLGPVIRSQVCLDHGMGTSPLERLCTDKALMQTNGVMLTANYRSDPRIVSVVNVAYQDKLVAMRPRLPARNGPDAVRITAGEREYMVPLRDQAVVMLHHEGGEKREGDSPSWMNRDEASMCIAIAHGLLKNHGVPLKDITILSPYRKQVCKIEQQLHAMYRDDPNVPRDHRGRPIPPLTASTVERFQGRENKVIILSCVRNRRLDLMRHDVKHSLGFFKQPQRANVAVSRAQDLLIVIGNLDMLCADNLWRSYIARARKNGSLYNLASAPQVGSAQPEPWVPPTGRFVIPDAAPIDERDALAANDVERPMERNT